MTTEVSSDLIRDVCKENKCNWAEAKEMIVEAQKILEIQTIETDEQRAEIKRKVAELWETRKPSAEDIARKKRAKEEAAKRKEEEEKEAKRLKRLQNDSNFRFGVCVCITCGLWLWCSEGGPLRSKKKEAPTNDEMERS